MYEYKNFNSKNLQFFFSLVVISYFAYYHLDLLARLDVWLSIGVLIVLRILCKSILAPLAKWATFGYLWVLKYWANNLPLGPHPFFVAGVAYGMLDVNDLQTFLSGCVEQNPHADRWRKAALTARVVDKKTPLAVKARNEHAEDANWRHCAEDCIHSFMESICRATYSVATSAKDVACGLPGTRDYFWHKDLHLPLQHDPLKNHGVKLIDVDYYLESHEFADLAWTGREYMSDTQEPRPIAMYTYLFGPLTSATSSSTVEWTEDNKLINVINGGAGFSHQVWDWNMDMVSFYSDNCVVNCHVIRTPAVGLRSVVILVPIWKACPVGAALMEMLHVRGDELARFEPVHNGVAVHRTGDVVYIARARTPVVYELSNAEFNDLMAERHNPSFNVSTIQNVTGQRYKLAYNLLACLNAIPEGFIPSLKPSVIKRPVDYRANTYYHHALSDDDGSRKKEQGRVFMRPLMAGTFVPRDCLASERITIDRRVSSLTNENLVVLPKYGRYRDEYAELFCQHAPKGISPLDEIAVIDKAHGTKKQQYKAGFNKPLSVNLSKAFKKVEAYPAPKDPRNISAIGTPHVVRYLRFILALSEYCKTFHPWYAFGLAPEQIANRVAEICHTATEKVALTDFERFDGLLETFMMSVEGAIMRRMFPDYVDEIMELRDATSWLVIASTHGTRYNSRNSRKSGSAITSWGNTIANCFHSYCSKRECGMSPKEAFDTLGIYGGDDGITTISDPKVLERVATDLGLRLKLNIKDGHDSVDFLARIYPRAFQGDNSSFTDPLRALSKFHYTADSDPNISVNKIVWRKAVSLYAADSRSVVGKVMEHYLATIGRGKFTEAPRRPDLECLSEYVGETFTFEDIHSKFYMNPVYPQKGITFSDSCEYLAKQLGITYSELKCWLESMQTKSIGAHDTLMPLPVDPPEGVVIGNCINSPNIPGPVIQLPKITPPCLGHLKQVVGIGKCSVSGAHKPHPTDLCKDYLRGWFKIKGKDGKIISCKRKKCKFSHPDLKSLELT